MTIDLRCFSGSVAQRRDYGIRGKGCIILAIAASLFEIALAGLGETHDRQGKAIACWGRVGESSIKGRGWSAWPTPTPSTWNSKADEIIKASSEAPEMTTDAVSVVVVVLFALFAGAVAYIIRPRNRRQSRRPVALSAATDSPDPPFVVRHRPSRFSRLRELFLGRRR
jgi:hypothetical protein